MFRIKRIYDEPDPEDGYRVLVDRLWPRGLSKDKAAVDEWLKDIAPSPELRKWFGHEEERWPGFVERYHAEMESPEKRRVLERLRQAEAEHGTVTMLFAAREGRHTHATLLLNILARGV